MINDVIVSTPDSERWLSNLTGTSLELTQRRSPYRQLVWRKQVVDNCMLEWFDYDNSVLDSLVTRAPGALREWTRYTDVILQSVHFVQNGPSGGQVEARFLVNIT